jgi:lysozyme
MKLTPRIVAYIAHEEGLVPEAYLDSVGVWTWALGVTNESGHLVYPRYLDKPQPLEDCLKVSVWLMERKYLPPVARAFHGFDLAEHQIAAALSFHWNTGAIERADWVERWRNGDKAEARIDFMNYRKPPSIIPRRTRERNLFFDAAWPGDMRCPVWRVNKAHKPVGGRPADIMGMLQQIMGGS